jgi:hypothetical protein
LLIKQKKESAPYKKDTVDKTNAEEKDFRLFQNESGKMAGFNRTKERPRVQRKNKTFSI